MNPQSESQIIEYLLANWEKLVALPGVRLKSVKQEVGRDGQQADLLLEVDWRGKPIQLLVEVKAARYIAEVRDAYNQLFHLREYFRNAHPVLVAPYLSEAQQEICKQLGLHYVDLSGNAWLDIDNIYLDRSGRQSRFREREVAKDVFSDKASLLLRVLLDNCQRPLGVRELASLASVSPGWASRVLSRVESMGYLLRGPRGVMIADASDLLMDWASRYDYKKNRISSYYVRFGSLDEGLSRIKKVSNSIRRREGRWALSLHAGAWLVARHAVVPQIHLYLLEDLDAVELAAGAEAEPVPEGGNFHLMEPYYKHGVTYGLRQVQGLPVVSDLQLYLDLYNYPARGREQAEFLYDQILKLRFASAQASDDAHPAGHEGGRRAGRFRQAGKPSYPVSLLRDSSS